MGDEVADRGRAHDRRQLVTESDMADAPEPDPGESFDDFMSRCEDETDGDRDACQVAWEDRGARSSATRTIAAVEHKTNASEVEDFEFILSDESVDRMGDVIQLDGWKLSAFKRNPIALFGHQSSFPIGTWKHIRIEDGALRAKLVMAPAGTSDRIDEIRRLIDAKILKATSVGFRPIKYEPIDVDDPWGGYKFIEHELVETSVVSVPANPNALAVAKSLDISAATLALVFAGKGKGNGNGIVRRSTGGQADTQQRRTERTKAMTPSQRIKEIDGQLSVLRAALQAHFDGLDDDNVSDADLQKSNDLAADIKKKNTQRESFVEMERALGLATSEETAAHEIRMPVRKIAAPTEGSTKVYAAVDKDAYKPGDYVWKSLVVLTKLQGDRYRKASALDVLRDTVGENDKVRAVFEALVGKAASVPALTTATGWAIELVRTEYAAWMDSLLPVAVAPRLINRGMSFAFGTNGIISIPMRNATPTVAGSFVGEGAAIPVRQAAFAAQQLSPKKLAVISTFSREISEHSDPQIEGILRQAIVDDTAVAIDSVLLDANPATAIRPAGLRNGVATLTPTAGGGFAAVVGDIKGLAGALTTSTLGNLRDPVWLMSPALELALMLTVMPNGAWAFPDIKSGSFMGWPTIVSATVTADTLYLVDAADFASASGPPRFDVSDQATLHMEDTAPLPISATGTPNVVAAPVRSLWQTDTLGIRMIQQMNWLMRRAAMVAYVTGVTWK
jgi:HK97 family phage prohead protease